jgi:hypothetical protein
MKKLLLLLSRAAFAVLLAFSFTACGAGDDDDIVGIWEGNYGAENAGTIILTINAPGTWTLTFQDNPGGSLDRYTGYWYRDGDDLTLEARNTGYSVSDTMIYANLIDNTLNMRFGSYYVIRRSRPATIELTKRDTSETSDNGNVALNATLRIRNESGFALSDVNFGGISFGNINPGSTVERSVPAGSGYIRLSPALSSSLNLRTLQVIHIANGEQLSFQIGNDTRFVNDSNSDNGNLAFFSGVSLLTIRQANDEIDQHGTFNFGTVRPNTSRDRVFTIENSGGRSLAIQTVNGNRVNLANNDSGAYSIIIQPLASSINPGASANFTIRFTPTATENNINAVVEIKTDSHIDSDFAFLINGTGRDDYQIGDTGPGGGIVFFASGGQYREYSAELGNFIWSAANTAAQAHRGGGFTNWRLPDSGDAVLVVNHLGRAITGTFQYWSSTPSGASYIAVGFPSFGTTPETFTVTPGNLLRTRAVRSFN